MRYKVTYYIFYLKETKEIYAYTDEKKISSVFIKQRDMSKFLYKKIKLESGEIHDLADGDERHKRLSMYTLDTFNDETNRKDTVSIVMTEIENITVVNTSASFSMVDVVVNAWIPFEYFKPVLKDLLKVLYYDKIHKTLSGKNGDDAIFDTADVIMEKYFDGIDELNIFLDKFGRTMRMSDKGA